MLIHFIYSSSAAVPFSDVQLVDLLGQARTANEAAGITGVLLHVDGSFFQVLEGSATAVEAVVAQISGDPRHQHVTRIIQEPIAQRSFQDWTMGFVSLSRRDLGAIVGHNDFFDSGSLLTNLDHGRAKKLLTAFAQGRWRTRIVGAREASAA